MPFDHTLSSRAASRNSCPSPRRSQRQHVLRPAELILPNHPTNETSLYEQCQMIHDGLSCVFLNTICVFFGFDAEQQGPDQVHVSFHSAAIYTLSQRAAMFLLHPHQIPPIVRSLSAPCTQAAARSFRPRVPRITTKQATDSQHGPSAANNVRLSHTDHARAPIGTSDRGQLDVAALCRRLLRCLQLRAMSMRDICILSMCITSP